MKAVRRVRTRKIICSFCPKSFTRTEHLRRHLGSHGVGKAVRCPQCGKEFMRKDVMKRHLTKCQFKYNTRSGEIIRQTPGSIGGGAQQIIHLQQDDNRNATDNQSTYTRQSQRLEAIGNDSEQAEPQAMGTNAPCTVRSPFGETRWSDMRFEDLRFLFEPMLPDRDEERNPQQLSSNGFGVPCININPADTFNFLARLANKETAPLVARYDCDPLHGSQWATHELLNNDMGRQIPATESIPSLPTAKALHPSWYDTSALCGNPPSPEIPPSTTQPGFMIVQQIKQLSQHSTIMHTWSPQLERDCIRFFSAKNVATFIEIYWAAWHPHYPVIHKPTFSIASAPIHLTAAMAIIGACFSSRDSDRQSVKLWLNSVEEMVFSNKYFGDVLLHDPATMNVREIVQLLQAAYCVCTFQTSEGSQVSRRRIRRQRFSLLVSLARDLNLFSVRHGNLDRLCGNGFCWDSFIATEECIRTALFIYMHDTAFAIFSNYPPRMRIQELVLEMACPEACFQAQTSQDCLTAIEKWSSHPLWKSRMTLREVVDAVLCTDISPNVQGYLSHLGILNMWIVCSALCSEAFQLNSLISVDTPLEPMRRAIGNWKAAWNQRYIIPDTFGLPKQEDEIVVRPEDSWKRLGFFQNASEYWLLLHVLVEQIGEEKQDRRDRAIGSAMGMTESLHTRPYTPSKCDSPTMADLKHLILEHHRRFRPYA